MGHSAYPCHSEHPSGRPVKKICSYKKGVIAVSRVYFVCILHNKIKKDEVWRRYIRNILHVLRKKKGRIVISSCDECKENYPF